MRFDAARRMTVAEAMSKVPTAEGKRFAPIFEHGSLQIEIYAPRGVDPQSPHDRDEIYVVVSGSGTFVNGGERTPFAPGDVLFAAAGEVHRFEDFSHDLVVWVFFYGPVGGDRSAQGFTGGEREMR